MTLLPLSSPTSTVIDMCQTKNGASVLWGQTCTGWVHGRLRLGTQGIIVRRFRCSHALAVTVVHKHGTAKLKGLVRVTNLRFCNTVAITTPEKTALLRKMVARMTIAILLSAGFPIRPVSKFYPIFTWTTTLV